MLTGVLWEMNLDLAEACLDTPLVRAMRDGDDGIGGVEESPPDGHDERVLGHVFGLVGITSDESCEAPGLPHEPRDGILIHRARRSVRIAFGRKQIGHGLKRVHAAASGWGIHDSDRGCTESRRLLVGTYRTGKGEPCRGLLAFHPGRVFFGERLEGSRVLRVGDCREAHGPGEREGPPAPGALDLLVAIALECPVGRAGGVEPRILAEPVETFPGRDHRSRGARLDGGRKLLECPIRSAVDGGDQRFGPRPELRVARPGGSLRELAGTVVMSGEVGPHGGPQGFWGRAGEPQRARIGAARARIMAAAHALASVLGSPFQAISPLRR